MNRTEMLERQVDGCAGFDFLRSHIAARGARVGKLLHSMAEQGEGTMTQMAPGPLPELWEWAEYY